MKKIFFITIVLSLGIILSGCLPKKVDETTTIGQPESTQQEQINNDDSVETIEKEIDQTTVQDFDKEINTLDSDINQL
ncbi:MAG: hypothetical protein NTZ93_03120 [Candidatus Beckwithbacteria bacterium]|nr:hypothetical protein [Candidatus Beckwithbacteria bacterium]